MTAGSQGRMRDSVEAVAGAVLEKYSNVSCPIVIIVSHVSNFSLIDGVDKRPVCVCRALSLCGDRSGSRASQRAGVRVFVCAP